MAERLTSLDVLVIIILIYYSYILNSNVGCEEAL